MTHLAEGGVLSIAPKVYARRWKTLAVLSVALLILGLDPLFGGLLLEWFSWISVFLVNVQVAGLALVAGFMLVPESRDPKRGAFDVPGAVLSIGALLALVYPIIEAQDRGWTNPMILG